MLEGAQELGSLTRRVGSRTLQSGEARAVVLVRTYDAAVEDVWDACTNPERIPRWFLPVSGELREGGRYQVEGNAGGTIERCEPPHGFTATWEYGGNVSWIELRLSQAPDGGTRFELEHISLMGEHWNQFGPGALGVGWDLGLLGLSQHLRTGDAVSPQDGAAFAGSEEGKRFIEQSAGGWGGADIAAGADRAHAEAAAQRTIAFYTGASAPEPGAGP